MKKLWPWAKGYLILFTLVFVAGLLINLSTEGEALCVTDNWCPNRKDSAATLALIFTVPFLILAAFMRHVMPHITRWILKSPERGLAIPFFISGIIPIVPLVVFPDEMPLLQKNLCYAAIAANFIFVGLVFIFAASKRQNRPLAVLLLIGLVLCMGLTVGAVAKWE